MHLSRTYSSVYFLLILHITSTLHTACRPFVCFTVCESCFVQSQHRTLNQLKIYVSAQPWANFAPKSVQLSFVAPTA